MKYTVEFLDEFVEGSKKCFDKVFKDYVDPLYQFCFFRVSDSNDAEDLVEEIFTKILKNQYRFDSSKSSLKTWIFTIARNTVIDFLRTNPGYVSEINDNVSDESMNLLDETNSILNAASLRLALHELSSSERELIEMRFIEDLSYAEISKITGKSSGSIRVSVSRAIAKLKQIFMDLGIDSSNI